MLIIIAAIPWLLPHHIIPIYNVHHHHHYYYWAYGQHSENLQWQDLVMFTFNKWADKMVWWYQIHWSRILDIWYPSSGSWFICRRSRIWWLKIELWNINLKYANLQLVGRGRKITNSFFRNRHWPSHWQRILQLNSWIINMIL